MNDGMSDDSAWDPTRDARRTDTREQRAWIPGMAEAPIPLSGLPPMEVIDMRTEAEQIKSRQAAYMTAALMWFVVISIILIAGSGVLRVCAHIL